MHSGPTSIFCTAVPGIGDAFLATPLFRALKTAYPDAAIDVLVREHRGGLLEHNPDIRTILYHPRRPTLAQTRALARHIWRRYDLAISTSYSDRSMLNCWLAAPRRITVLPHMGLSQLWKRLLADSFVLHDESRHVILQNLAIADCLGIPSTPRCIVPTAGNSSPLTTDILTNPQPFVLAQLGAGATYKQLPVSFWTELLDYVESHGHRILFTGGSSDSEIQLAHDLCQHAPTSRISLCGRLSFGDIATLCERATAFIGVDTATTHLAAATGLFTIAIYGSGNVSRWAPWPRDHRDRNNPFANQAGLHQCGNVIVLKAECTCVPFRRQCRITRQDGLTDCLYRTQANTLFACLDQQFRAVKNARPGIARTQHFDLQSETA